MPKRKTTVVVRGQYEFEHQYLGAPAAVSYLRNLHRHLFNYEVEIEVFHDDRELEFIMLKHAIDDFLVGELCNWPSTCSCEEMATSVANWLQKKYGQHRQLMVAVFEDNENGAKVYM